jgi:hypothetical protein
MLQHKPGLALVTKKQAAPWLQEGQLPHCCQQYEEQVSTSLTYEQVGDSQQRFCTAVQPVNIRQRCAVVRLGCSRQQKATSAKRSPGDTECTAVI